MFDHYPKNWRTHNVIAISLLNFIKGVDGKYKMLQCNIHLTECNDDVTNLLQRERDRYKMIDDIFNLIINISKVIFYKSTAHKSSIFYTLFRFEKMLF